LAGYPQFHCSFTKFTPDFSCIAAVGRSVAGAGEELASVLNRGSITS
jgi:hypothetical protein